MSPNHEAECTRTGHHERRRFWHLHNRRRERIRSRRIAGIAWSLGAVRFGWSCWPNRRWVRRRIRRRIRSIPRRHGWSGRPIAGPIARPVAGRLWRFVVGHGRRRQHAGSSETSAPSTTGTAAPREIDRLLLQHGNLTRRRIAINAVDRRPRDALRSERTRFEPIQHGIRSIITR